MNVADPGSPEALSYEDFLHAIRDRRRYHAPGYVDDHLDRRVHYSPRYRDWSEVTGICLHQTACDMGERPERYDTIGAHWSVQRSGGAIWHCDNDRVVVHGNGWNNRCVGIEINGLYAGREDDPRTAVDEALASTWDNPGTNQREQPMTLTPEAAVTARQLVRWIVEDVRRHGGQVRFLVAHRQSSSSRRNDPGEAIWRAVALPLLAELGLSTGGPGFRIGSGRPLPACWGEPDGSAY